MGSDLTCMQVLIDAFTPAILYLLNLTADKRKQSDRDTSSLDSLTAQGFGWISQNKGAGTIAGGCKQGGAVLQRSMWQACALGSFQC